MTQTIQAGTRSSFQFAGKHGYVSDEDTGMQLLGHRYYLPWLSRFLAATFALRQRNPERLPTGSRAYRKRP